MKYKWKRMIKGLSPQIAGEQIAKIIQANNGHIKPVDVVESAKPVRSPLHNTFDWNDRSAAEKYRVEQAKYILRQLVIVRIQEDDEPIIIRAFVSVRDEDDSPVYTSIDRAAQNPEEWEYVINQAYEELQAWKEKYRTLRQFETVFEAIESLEIK